MSLGLALRPLSVRPREVSCFTETQRIKNCSCCSSFREVSILDRSIRRRVDCIFCFFFFHKEIKDFAYVTWDSSLGNWQPFLHFHSCSRTLRVTGQGRVWW